MDAALNSISELFDQIASPGDAATVLLAGTAGLVADAGLNIVGFLSPGSCGVAAASTALGLKKAYEAKRQGASAVPELERAARALTLCADSGFRKTADLAQAVRLRKAGLIDDAALSSEIDSLVAAYRVSPVGLVAPGAELVGADLSDLDLSGRDLSGADLTGADLSFANLRRANLRGANLTHATLHDADLRDADLTDAALTNADLTGVRLAGASLERCDLDQSHGLRRADVDDVRGWWTHASHHAVLPTELSAADD